MSIQTAKYIFWSLSALPVLVLGFVMWVKLNKNLTAIRKEDRQVKAAVRSEEKKRQAEARHKEKYFAAIDDRRRERRR